MTICDSSFGPGGCDSCEIIHEGPIVIAKYEYTTGAQGRAKNAIAGEKGTLERNRYIEKQRIVQTIKIICDSPKMSLIYRDIVRGSTQETLYDMGRSEEMYYGTIAQYMGRYLWEFEDFLPGKDAEVRNVFQGHRMGYFPRSESWAPPIIVGK